MNASQDRTSLVRRMRRWTSYIPPQQVYATLLDNLVSPGTRWLDVGCGESPLPDDRAAAARLAARTGALVGVDPDGAIERNEFVSTAHRLALEEFRTEQTYDLITLRMVCEHVAKPDEFVRSLGRLSHAGTRVVVLTVSSRSLVSRIVRITPKWIRNRAAARLWGTPPAATHEIYDRLNEPETLPRSMALADLRLVRIDRIDDCQTTVRIATLHLLELSARWILRLGRVGYPEYCILAEFERVAG